MAENKLVWETGIPKEEGYYWVKGAIYGATWFPDESEKAGITHIHRHGDELYYHTCGHTHEWKFEYPVTFAGPLSSPG